MKKSTKERVRVSPAEGARFARELTDSMRDMGGYDTGGCFHVLTTALLFTLADMAKEERGRAIAALEVLIEAMDRQP